MSSEVSLQQFAVALLEHGELVVPGRPELDWCLLTDASAAGQLEDYLREQEQVWHRSCPGEPPEFLAERAVTALSVLAALCHAIVVTDLGVADIDTFLQEAALRPSESPADHYSVDLVFRFLPQVEERAGRLIASDPLLQPIRRLGSDWPLSGVGTKLPQESADAGEADPKSSLPAAPIRDHPCLFQMYIDRVLRFGDLRRASPQPIRSFVRAVAGPYPELQTPLLRSLESGETDSENPDAARRDSVTLSD